MDTELVAQLATDGTVIAFSVWRITWLSGIVMRLLDDRYELNDDDDEQLG